MVVTYILVDSTREMRGEYDELPSDGPGPLRCKCQLWRQTLIMSWS